MPVCRWDGWYMPVCRWDGWYMSVWSMCTGWYMPVWSMCTGGIPQGGDVPGGIPKGGDVPGGICPGGICPGIHPGYMPGYTSLGTLCTACTPPGTVQHAPVVRGAGRGGPGLKVRILPGWEASLRLLASFPVRFGMALRAGLLRSSGNKERMIG